MANKLVFLGVALTTLIALTHATHTVITTEVDTDTDMSNQGMGQCHGQMMYPQMCEKYMKQTTRRGGRFQSDDEVNQRGGRRMMEQCCDELRMMEPSCQCQAMKMMMMGMGGMHGGSQMMGKVMKLPMMCGTMQRMCPMSTMITTVVDTNTDMSNQGMGQCRGKMMYPQMCEKYMKQMTRQGGRFESDDDVNQRGGGGMMMEQCCDELRMMEPSCQCQAMKMMMKEMPGQMMMMEKMMMLPMMCGTMHRMCPMSTM